MIELVDSNPDYVSLWLKWRGEASTLRYNPIVPSSIEELRVRMENMSSDLSLYESFFEFQFFIKFESELVGTVSLKKTSPMMRYGEIAYEVGEAYHGRGIGTKAVRKFVDKVFAETQLRRLVAYVAEGNRASRRLLEKIGFVQEGICREHYIINGVPTNEILYGILRSDLENLNANSESLILETSSEIPYLNAGLFSRIKAVMVHVPDPIAGLKWYEKAFPEAKKVHLPEYDFEFLILNGVQVEIVQADEKVGVGTCGLAVDWDVKSFDQALHHLFNLGAVLYRGPMKIEDGNRMCKLKDPFGNLIGLRGP